MTRGVVGRAQLRAAGVTCPLHSPFQEPLRESCSVNKEMGPSSLTRPMHWFAQEPGAAPAECRLAQEDKKALVAKQQNEGIRGAQGPREGAGGQWRGCI